jgi:hypothetical protein
MQLPSQPLFTRFLSGQEFPRVKTGIKAGTGAEFTYTLVAPNRAVVTDVIYGDPTIPPGGESS